MDNVNFNIRIITQDELPHIREIAHRTWPISYKEMISDDQICYMLEKMYSDDALRLQMTFENATFFLLSSESENVGFASCGPSSNLDVFKLHKLYVLPHFQKSGVGSQLLNCCLDFARLNGAKEIFLQVNRSNSAIDFYCKHGFIIDREEKFDIGNGFIMDDYIMKFSWTSKG